MLSSCRIQHRPLRSDSVCGLQTTSLECRWATALLLWYRHLQRRHSLTAARSRRTLHPLLARLAQSRHLLQARFEQVRAHLLLQLLYQSRKLFRVEEGRLLQRFRLALLLLIEQIDVSGTGRRGARVILLLRHTQLVLLELIENAK